MDSPSFETIDWEFNTESGIGRITLDRQDRMNALSKQSYEEIKQALDRFDDIDYESLYVNDDGVAVRAVIFEGAGEKAFCTGTDVDSFHEVKPGVFDFTEMFNRVETFDPPTIAKIDGYALGGGFELALTCDFRIASSRSEFGFPEINLGIIPGDGGTQRLPELVGPSRTKELCMTGEHVEAENAATEGMIDYVYPVNELEDEVWSFAEKLANKPPLGVRAVKEVVNMSQEASLRVGRYYERRAGSTLTQTEDHQEGVQAFQDKRSPDWKGK